MLPVWKENYIWVKVFKNGSSKIFGRQPLKNLQWYGLPSRPYYFKFFKGCLPQILLGSFLNTLTHFILLFQHRQYAQAIFLLLIHWERAMCWWWRSLNGKHKFIFLFRLNKTLDAVTEFLQSLGKKKPGYTNHHNSNNSNIGKMKMLLGSIRCK